MKRTGSFDTNLRIKEHIHTFVNEGGHLGALPVPPFALEDGSLCHAEKEQGPPAVEEVPP